MDKETFTRQALTNLGIDHYISTKFVKNIDLVKYIVLGQKTAGLSGSIVAKIAKTYFPDKPPRKPIFYYLCQLNEVKYCPSCEKVLPFDKYWHSEGQMDNKQSYCKVCQYEREAYYRAAKSMRYKAAKLNRTPKWVDHKEINKIYNKCPKGYHVDHIIPLQGVNVSGLHVPENLQYLSAAENLRKGNKYEE